MRGGRDPAERPRGDGLLRGSSFLRDEIEHGAMRQIISMPLFYRMAAADISNPVETSITVALNAHLPAPFIAFVFSIFVTRRTYWHGNRCLRACWMFGIPILDDGPQY